MTIHEQIRDKVVEVLTAGWTGDLPAIYKERYQRTPDNQSYLNIQVGDENRENYPDMISSMRIFDLQIACVVAIPGNSTGEAQAIIRDEISEQVKDILIVARDGGLRGLAYRTILESSQVVSSPDANINITGRVMIFKVYIQESR